MCNKYNLMFAKIRVQILSVDLLLLISREIARTRKKAASMQATETAKSIGSN